MVFEHCLSERNATLLTIYGSPERIPDQLPPSGALLNVTNGNGSLANLIMPELPECDLQKELDNVSNDFFCILLCNYYYFLGI